MKVDIYKSSIKKHLKPKAKISAIIPNYNYADFIIERIDSILFQTYPISELIILDDASTDNSIAVIKEKIELIKQKKPELKVKFLKNKENSGGCVFAQWQKGIKAASGEYIWIAEADDSCSAKFLETAMRKFSEHKSAVLFYSDSYRINQDNVVKSHTCTDWMDMWRSGRYNSDFFNDGKDEIINYLSGTNPILNVSSVVWKNIKELNSIFEEAKEYKVAGDWYIYSRVLEYGDIVYSAKPLNYYRKHDKGSASTVVKLNTEYGEVVKVQERISHKYKLTKDRLEWQLVRRRGMGFVENEKNNGKKGTIAWIVPWFSEGSGGHRTIFTNLNHLVKHGYKCDMYVQSLKKEYPNEIYDRIKDGYGEFYGDVFSGYQLAKKYDMVIATGWDTAETVAKADTPRKMYFIQDFEPWFFPMSSEYLIAEQSYSLGLQGVTIGKWLSSKIGNNYPTPTTYFNFCADLNKYHKLSNVKKERAICLIFQPGKPRRCDKMALKALQIVQAIDPTIKIYLYGSARRKVYNLKVTHLGTITESECNKLYNKCSVGLCMSASNPSRIPFEMMAAGLPVVELYHENNLYDLPEDGCLLAEPNSEAIATAILEIFADEKLQKKMSAAGYKYMQEYPIEKGYQQFIEIIDKSFSNKNIENEAKKIKKSYQRPAVTASKDTILTSDKITKPVTISNIPMTSEYIKAGFSKRAVRKAKRLIKKTYHFIRSA
ncbi:glycosyltransferase [Candidatus Saccharibacteria bacterium]|nr:glycosyltransferase [Candidatus Saccharibacteria bacterium]